MEKFNQNGSMGRCIARSEIESLLHRYAVLATDAPEIDKMIALFHKDGFFRLPDGKAVKPEKFFEVIRGNKPQYARHHITSIDIQFVSPTEAHTQAYFIAMTQMSSVDHWGEWKDIVIKQEDGAWLIADRTCVVDGGDPKGWFRSTYPELGASLLSSVASSGET
ncbi:hypothetical protein H2204_009963 [Knufia peltigerae]|uniref:SnoaL-like domain-containing protein n=1 Tax=Knufia peltigerae TaxID=1002370 RepID=A0AA38XX13_9EURO|nr:hypothetical protein H2204_009963 [Knufia peltigerae]